MTSIFVSYSRKDEVFARLLATDLERMGATIWIDVEDIPAGIDWRNAIDEGLQRSDVLLLIVSPDSLTSEYVAREWQYFLSRGKPIIPIRWRNVNKLPSEIERVQYIDFETQSYNAARLILERNLNKYHISPHHKITNQTIPVLRKRDEELELSRLVTNATEICVVAVSSARVIGGNYYGLLKEKLASGCNLSIILMDPNTSDALPVFNRFAKWDHTYQDTIGALDMYGRLMRNPDLNGKCEVRLINFYMSYSMVGINLNDENGLIRISYFGYKATGDVCPQSLFSPKMDWYAFYVRQFKSLWKIAIPFATLSDE